MGSDVVSASPITAEPTVRRTWDRFSLFQRRCTPRSRWSSEERRLPLSRLYPLFKTVALLAPRKTVNRLLSVTSHQLSITSMNDY